ncbi:NUDIX hydrolase [Nocardioides dongxiaopingii]|uniref:NUDIX domain-containing protein n=1 Tax=Nocardioides sp. S-1144 TaxID=2582905 RepID=UPI00110F59CB|nr:NUDIX hydrolase [Nocardioides sp. S-1144]QCW50832.1 NUDIX hydrolase [Nocardioides sp. S-1144]
MHRFASTTLVDPHGRLLVQERDEHPRIDPERWGFPGGGVEEGESYEQAAYRELAEETGVVLDGGLVLWGERTFFSEPCGGDDTFRLYAARTELTEVECHEGRQMVFVEPARLRTLPLTTSCALVLDDFLASDLYRELLP